MKRAADDAQLPGAGTPWYRHPWMWLVVGLPLLSVVATTWMAVTAVRNKDDLVRDDWYKAGRMINQDMRADAHAKALGLSAVVTLQPAELTVSVRISETGTQPLPERLQLALTHNTIASEDMTSLLQRGADGLWHGSLPRLPLGKRYLSLEPLLPQDDPTRWRLRAPETTFVGEPVALSPLY